MSSVEQTQKEFWRLWLEIHNQYLIRVCKMETTARQEPGSVPKKKEKLRELSVLHS